MTVRIVGLDRGESDAILNYLYSVYEGNVDIQVRFKWTPGSSALWDNRYDTMYCDTWQLADDAESPCTMHHTTMREKNRDMARE